MENNTIDLKENKSSHPGKMNKSAKSKKTEQAKKTVIYDVWDWRNNVESDDFWN